MKKTQRIIHCILATAVTLALAGPVSAMEVDWFGGLSLSDGDRSFLNISAAHFNSDQQEARHLAGRLTHPEADLPVLLFLAAESGRSTRFVLDLRLGGLSWWEIRARLGVEPERVVVQLPRDPGPPYGKAWGHYRNRPDKKAGSPGAVALSDREFADWVGARVVSRTYDIDVVTVLESRSQGQSMGDVVRQQKSRNQSASATGKSPASRNNGNNPRGRSQQASGKNAGKGKSGR